MENKETLTLAENNKRTEDRPSKSTRKDELPQPRIPLSGAHRDILTVGNKNPRFQYRWVLDTSVEGTRIYHHQRAGYEFAPYEEDGEVLQIGLGFRKPMRPGGGVKKAPSVIMVPASKTDPNAGHHYLMRIKKEWFEEDRAREQQEVDEVERGIALKAIDEDDKKDFYGKIEINAGGGMQGD